MKCMRRIMRTYKGYIKEPVLKAELELLPAYVDAPEEEAVSEMERRRTRAGTEKYKIPFSIYMEDGGET